MEVLGLWQGIQNGFAKRSTHLKLTLRGHRTHSQLHMDPKRLVHKDVHDLFDKKQVRSPVLMDVSSKWSWEEFKELSQNQDGWCQIKKSVRVESWYGVTVVMNDVVTPVRGTQKTT